MIPPPEELQLNEYIELYIKTKDEKYFFSFLHYYEPQMNAKAMSYANKCDINEYFSDIKQSIALGLFKALHTYDMYASPFLSYAEWYVEREVNEFLRSMIPSYSVQSEFEYARLRKTMALFHEADDKSDIETIKSIAEKVGVSPERVVAMLVGGLRNERKTDLYDEEGEENDELLADASSNPYLILEKEDLYDKLYDAYMSLNYTERMMLSQRFGFCPECLSTVYRDKDDLDENGEPTLKSFKLMPYTDIATSHGFSDPDSAKRICDGALIKMSEMMKYGKKAEEIHHRKIGFII